MNPRLRELFKSIVNSRSVYHHNTGDTPSKVYLSRSLFIELAEELVNDEVQQKTMSEVTCRALKKALKDGDHDKVINLLSEEEKLRVCGMRVRAKDYPDATKFDNDITPAA